ncbi:spore coat protein CotH [Winogradskyella sp. PC-19]|uniref:CotH kinase family protein n=1 Tax=unclassified Winogradskyella TaxID=2615021 RepID=UPI000B3CE8CF|nr:MULTISPECIES: CotH kinase family protein [unclassified Winogradskyella]ARV10534.1 spore coat protein CotH [Winogradskyella sp. PC-19]
MGEIKSSVIAIIFMFLSINLYSQEIVAEKGSFGIDEINGIIVWFNNNLNSQNVSSITFDTVYVLENSTKLSYNKSFSLKSDKSYKLYVTKLPIIHITMDNGKMNSRKKIAGKFSYYDSEQFFGSAMSIRHRGNLSLSFNKKSFDIELGKDVKFMHMRSDDDWILDAMYNEPLRLRSLVAANIWNTIHKPYYLNRERNAKSGFEVSYVEVFKNNTYYGLYQLSESVDRKQLQVKKNNGNIIKGRIYKAESYEGGPDFTKAPDKYENALPLWIGWQSEYPFLDYNSDFEDLFQFQQLVVNGSDEDFKTKISEAFVLGNAIDYFLFVNAIRATDNLGKNYYLAKYDKGEPYFIVPWDLDGTFGVIQDGKQIRTTNDILSNGLFKRLIELNPDDYKKNLKSRWDFLRKNIMSDKNLFSKINFAYVSLTEQKIYEREQLVWQNKLTKVSNETHYTYLETWLKNRLSYLDSYFKNL